MKAGRPLREMLQSPESADTSLNKAMALGTETQKKGPIQRAGEDDGGGTGGWQRGC